MKNVLLEASGGSQMGLAAAPTVLEITPALAQVLIFQSLRSGMWESSNLWSGVLYVHIVCNLQRFKHNKLFYLGFKIVNSFRDSDFFFFFFNADK